MNLNRNGVKIFFMKWYYITLFALSILFALIYVSVYRKRFNVFITLIFSFVPIANLGYLLINQSVNIQEARIGIILTYIGGCYLNLFTVYTVFELSAIKIKKFIRILLFLLSTGLLLSVFTIGKSPYFYKSLSGQIIDGNFILTKEYGTLHTVYYILLICYLLICVGVNIYSMKNRVKVSHKIIKLFLIIEICLVWFFFGKQIFNFKVDLIPMGYVVSLFLLFFVIRRISLCDVSGTVIDALAMNGETGFVSFNCDFEYLGSNHIARKIFPELKQLQIDKSATDNPAIDKEIISKIRLFINDESKNSFFEKYTDKIYQIDIRRMYDKKRKTGYILYIQDDTKDQKYISLLNKFNDKLKEEVANKTEHIVKMHDNLILGMATMVESRDNSTGGHIRRTSEVVSILVEEINNDNSPDALKLSAEFCHNLIKAAPMHDLGKISVDDAILRKPGKFTDEEFAKMKTHAEEGAKIVHEILKETDDVDFHLLAENVAHYHHERWDGSGYPKGLKGEEIPLEARIMAVADVYDALVSKRVYKEAMSFEKANSIMMESFGKHFDKQLEKYYVKARPRLEAYYSNEE